MGLFHKLLVSNRSPLLPCHTLRYGSRVWIIAWINLFVVHWLCYLICEFLALNRGILWANWIRSNRRVRVYYLGSDRYISGHFIQPFISSWWSVQWTYIKRKYWDLSERLSTWRHQCHISSWLNYHAGKLWL